MNQVAAIAAPRAVRFDPDARSFEAYRFGISTYLLDPLAATTLDESLAETTSRWAWDRGDRFGIREIGPDCDRLHIHAVRRASRGRAAEHRRWLDLICTIDLNVIAGIPHGLVGVERDLHARRQAQRPTGAPR